MGALLPKGGGVERASNVEENLIYFQSCSPTSLPLGIIIMSVHMCFYRAICPGID